MKNPSLLKKSFLAFLFVFLFFSKPAYPRLELIRKETLKAGYGVKSVLISPDGADVYSLNLEAMSIYDFDRASREIRRKLVFVPHKGKGFDYKKKKWIDSYQEKPVEAHITHNGRFLWASLHNAGGVVVWDLQGGDTCVDGRPCKEAWLHERIVNATAGGKPVFSSRKIKLLLIKTGRTPKVIAASPDGRYLFVANWHSNTVSVIRIASPNPADWAKIADFKAGPVPRGLAVSPDSRYLYVAIMGGNAVRVFDLDTFKPVHDIRVGVNPRHILLDGHYLYASLNMASRLVKVDTRTDRVLDSADTDMAPRTVAISRDKRFIFAVCYKGGELQAFSGGSLRGQGAWKSPGRPVAVDVYQGGDIYEVWVGDYTAGRLNVFTLKDTGSGRLLTERKGDMPLRP